MTTDYPVHNETGPYRLAGTILDLNRGMRLDLDIRISQLTGERVLYFPLQSVSDIHWESEFSRAKRLCMVLRDVESGVLIIPGDMIGGIEMMKKETEHVGPYHRQGAALMFQKKPIVVGGNHEVGIERHLKRPFTLFGMTVHDETEYRDPKGRLFLVEHGHRRRYKAMGDIDHKKWDNFGDTLLHLAGRLDRFLQEKCGLEKASVAMWCKKRFKKFINDKMNVITQTEQAIDGSRYAGNLSGDTHMAGFHHTPGGKLLINDGSCCDHVQYAVHDKQGNWACITHHRDHMEVEMEDGNKYTVDFAEIGLDHFRNDPIKVENEYTAMADRMFHTASRMWPAKDRQNIHKKVEECESTVARLCDILDVKPTFETMASTSTSVPSSLYWSLHHEQTRLANLIEIRRDNKRPPRSMSKPEKTLVAAA